MPKILRVLSAPHARLGVAASEISLCLIASSYNIVDSKLHARLLDPILSNIGQLEVIQ